MLPPPPPPGAGPGATPGRDTASTGCFKSSSVSSSNIAGSKSPIDGPAGCGAGRCVTGRCGAGARLGFAAAAGRAAAAATGFAAPPGARNCFPQGHLTTFPAADSGIFKTAEQAGHLIFMCRIWRARGEMNLEMRAARNDHDLASLYLSSFLPQRDCRFTHGNQDDEIAGSVSFICR